MNTEGISVRDHQGTRLSIALAAVLLVIFTMWINGCGGKDEEHQDRGEDLVPSSVQAWAPPDTTAPVPELAPSTQTEIPEPVVSATPSQQPVTTTRTESPQPEQPAPVAGPPPSQREGVVEGYLGPYCLQVGSFRTTERANRRTADLEAAGYAVTIVEATVYGDQYYRIYLPNLPTGEDAERLGENIQRNLGFDFLVRKIK